jgi:hypothetical protein
MIHIPPGSISRFRSVGCASLVALMSTVGLLACGSGGGESSSPSTSTQSPTACSLSVITALDINSPSPYTDGGDGGNGGGVSSGDAAPADGMYRNAKVQIQSADGSQSEAEIDGTNGKVHFEARGCTGPYLLTLKTRSDTQYYDESTASFRPLPLFSDNDLHAMVARIDKNIGITMLTEAAYQYLGHGLNADWKDAAKVEQANDYIKNLFNKYLPNDLQVSDITRLPAIFRGNTASQSVDDTENGIYGVVNAGIARAAGLLRGDVKDGDSMSSWLISRQISKDLCDGVLDYKCNGTPVVSTDDNSSQASYLIPQLGAFIGTGIGDVSARCANQDVVDKTFKIIEAKIDTAFPYGFEGCPNCTTRRPRPVYSERTPIWILGNNGQLYYWDRSSPNLTPAASGQIFTQLISQGRFIGQGKYDRSAPKANVFAREEFNASGAGTPVPRYAPLPSMTELSTSFSNVSTVTALDTVVWNPLDQTKWWNLDSVVVRSTDGGAKTALAHTYFNFALTPVEKAGHSIVAVGLTNSWGVLETGLFFVDSKGKVYAKGSNTGNQLGVGNAAPKDPDGGVSLTQMNFGDDFIVSVAGRFEGGFAVTSKGDVYGWGGSGVSQALGQEAAPLPVKLPVFGTRKIRRIECTHMQQCAAITTDGKMLVWGTFPRYTGEEVERGSDPLAAEEVKVPVEIPGRRVISIGANGWSIHGVLDDGGIVVFPSTVASMQVLRPTMANITSGSCQQP